MEKWKEVLMEVIPIGNYQTRLINGEDNGLIIELYNTQNIVKINFGIVKAIRMLDEGIVQSELYSSAEINKYKDTNFRNVIYEILDGEFENQIHRIAGSYWDIIHPRHYIVITMNYNIDIISEWEPTVEIKKVKKYS